MTLAVSSHSVIVSRAPSATPTIFTEIAELDQVSLPELMRNEFDASVQNRLLDSYVMGMLRRGPVPLVLNWLPSDTTHDAIAGLYSAIIANSFDGYKFVQLTTGMLWVASGQVKSMSPATPTDGKLKSTVTLRFSGAMGISSNNGAVMTVVGP